MMTSRVFPSIPRSFYPAIAAGLLLSAALAFYACYFYGWGGLVKEHQRFLSLMDEGDYLPVMHPGIYWFALLTSRISGGEITMCFYLILSLHLFVTLPVIAWALAHVMREEKLVILPWVLLFFAIAVMTANPLILPWLPTKLYNYRSWSRSFLLARNSTHTAVVPYAIASFSLIAAALQQWLREPAARLPRSYLLGGLLLAVSALMKPSFAASMIPAMVLFIAFCRRLPLNKKAALLVVLVPAGVVIAAQFTVGFIYNPLSPLTLHPVIDPFRVWIFNNRYPLLSFLLALAFPLYVMVFRAKSFMPATIIAWLNLFIALIPYSLFAQSQDMSPSWDRDFEWSYVYAKQIVFFCSAIECWRWRGEKKSPAFRVAILLLMLHALSGLGRLFWVDWIPTI